MKTIISIFFLVFFSVAAFATTPGISDDTEKGKKKKTRRTTKGQIEMVTEEEPAANFIDPTATQANKQVTVKVFDTKGKVVMEKKVQIESIFNKDYSFDDLPKGSIFVMLYDSTVYYFKES